MLLRADTRVCSECTTFRTTPRRSASAKAVCGGRLCTGGRGTHPNFGSCHGACSDSSIYAHGVACFLYGYSTAYARPTAPPIRSAADDTLGHPSSRGLDASPASAPGDPCAQLLGIEHVQWSKSVADVAIHSWRGSDTDGRLASARRDPARMVTEGMASDAEADECGALADHTVPLAHTEPCDAVDAACSLGRHEAPEHGAVGDRQTRHSPALDALRPGRDVPGDTCHAYPLRYRARERAVGSGRDREE